MKIHISEINKINDSLDIIFTGNKYYISNSSNKLNIGDEFEFYENNFKTKYLKSPDWIFKEDKKIINLYEINDNNNIISFIDLLKSDIDKLDIENYLEKLISKSCHLVNILGVEEYLKIQVYRQSFILISNDILILDRLENIQNDYKSNITLLIVTLALQFGFSRDEIEDLFKINYGIPKNDETFVLDKKHSAIRNINLNYLQSDLSEENKVKQHIFESIHFFDEELQEKIGESTPPTEMKLSKYLPFEYDRNIADKINELNHKTYQAKALEGLKNVFSSKVSTDEQTTNKLKKAIDLFKYLYTWMVVFLVFLFIYFFLVGTVKSN